MFTLDSLEGLLHGATDVAASSLPVDHNGEALEVSEVGTGVGLSELLGVGNVVEGLLDFVVLEGLDDGASASSLEHGNALSCQSKSLDGVLAAGEVRGINQNGVHVADIDDHDALSVVFTI